MSWVLIYILNSTLVVVQDLPSQQACLDAVALVTAPGAHSFACKPLSPEVI